MASGILTAVLHQGGREIECEIIMIPHMNLYPLPLPADLELHECDICNRTTIYWTDGEHRYCKRHQPLE